MENPFSVLCEGLATQCKRKGVCHFGDCPVNHELVRRYGCIHPLCDWVSADIWAVSIARMFFGQAYLSEGWPNPLVPNGTIGDVLDRIKRGNETRGRLEDAERKAEAANCHIRR